MIAERPIPGSARETAGRPLRVLYLTQIFPQPGDPSRGTYNFNTAVNLAHDCEIRVLSPVPWWERVRRPHTLLAGAASELDGLRVDYPTWWSVPRGTALHARALARSLQGRVRGLRREFPFDVVLVSCAYPDATAAAHLAAAAGVPLVTLVMGSDINEMPRNPALRPQIVRTLLQSHRVVAVSAALRERILELGIPAGQVVVQHNGVDGARFHIRGRDELRSRLGLPHDRRLVVYVGNLREEKGVEVLVEAAARVCAGGPADVDFAIVGGGPLFEKLRARIDALGVGGRIRLPGKLPNEQVPDWIGAADVFCLPSFREGCPNVILEALACGRPVVATEVGGIPELLGAENGVMVPAGDAGRLEDGLRRALARAWDPAALRATVPCLSWREYAATVRKLLEHAVQTGVP